MGRTPIILSHGRLTPPLHSRLRTLRFSLDGKYILLQDEATVYVLTRSPLAVKLAFPASLALPVRFTADSKGIVVALRDMRARRWDIESGEAGEPKRFGEGTDCFMATLSPHGNFYACLEMDSTLRVFRVDTGEVVFSGRVGEERDPHAPAILPFHTGLARSEPFGYYIGGLSLPPLDNVALSSNLQFSPDEHYLLALAWWETAAVVDLQLRRKIGVAGSLKHAIDHGSLEFVADDRMAYVSMDKADDSALLSFPKGDVVAKLGIIGAAQGTSDPNYLIHFSPDGQTAEVLDLRTGKPASKILKEGGDVFGGESVSYSPETGLAVTPVDAEIMKVLALVPPTPLTVLRTALASPDLKTLALGIAGHGGVFRISDGKQIAHFPGLRGAWFDGEQQCYVRAPRSQPRASDMQRVDVRNGATEKLWAVDDPLFSSDHLMSGSVVLSELLGVAFLVDPKRTGIPYNLQAEDLNTGKVLWSRNFGGGRGTPSDTVPPLTFDDPQGERIMLGWEADTDGAKKAAKRNAAIAQVLKQSKANPHDTVFEVLDARTGSDVGVAFVPGGSGPQGYTSAFSAGDWLILVKDEVRITAVSLSTGEERLKLTARGPALYGETGLLAVAEEGGHLLLYDLKSAERRDAFDFPNEVVYSRFSADGKRLLVLTQDQSVYVLDLAASLSSPPTKASGATSP